MDLFASEPSPKEPYKAQRSTTVYADQPLATRMRPQSLEEFEGQDHLVGEGKMLRRMIESGTIGSLIFYGPPSSGKTTLAHVISKEVNARFEVINAVVHQVLFCQSRSD